MSDMCLCDRCKRPIQLAAKRRREDSRPFRLAKVPKGVCADCVMTQFLYNTYPINMQIDRAGPEGADPGCRAARAPAGRAGMALWTASGAFPGGINLPDDGAGIGPRRNRIQCRSEEPNDGHYQDTQATAVQSADMRNLRQNAEDPMARRRELCRRALRGGSR